MGGPDHLPVYLTNRCNLACSYCYVAVNQGPPARLDLHGLKGALDEFLSGEGAPRKKVTFLGGEPFLDFELMAAAARHVRERFGDEPVLQTFTNGTLLTPERYRTLSELGVHVTISIDGKREVNDAKRVFHGRGGSVLDEVLRRLEGLPLGNLGASLVFTAENVDRLLSGVDYFQRMGFGRITFTPELYETWTEEKVAVLEATLRGFRRYYRKILDGGARPFVIPILFAVLENEGKGEGWWHDCHNVTLGPDAKYYACDKALTFPIGKAAGQRVGGVADGQDWGARAAHYRRAIDYIDSRGLGEGLHFCPMGPFFYSEIAGEDPEPRLRSFARVSRAFSEGLLALIAENREHPAFRDLYVHAHVA